MDRRAFPRYVMSCPVHFQVELLGSQFLVEKFDSNGVLINVSRRGMLAQIDRLLAVGTSCSITLFQSKEMVRPSRIKGMVRRSATASSGWEIGVEFESLVEVVAKPAQLA